MGYLLPLWTTVMCLQLRWLHHMQAAMREHLRFGECVELQRPEQAWTVYTASHGSKYGDVLDAMSTMRM